MYDEQDAMGQGVSTGWSGLDNYYRVCHQAVEFCSERQ